MDEYITKDQAKQAVYEYLYYERYYGASYKDKIDSIPAADVVSGSDFRDCVNELCLRCGQYQQEHLGACDGCRWLKARRGR